MIKFMSIASGSSGNCYYLSNGNQALLIDAGIPLRSISKALKDQLLSLEGHVMGVLVTHDHADHIRTVGSLGDKLNLPVF
ncbi:MBL fold metallo-hydrolase, partial [Porphyromonas loveana]